MCTLYFSHTLSTRSAPNITISHTIALRSYFTLVFLSPSKDPLSKDPLSTVSTGTAKRPSRCERMHQLNLSLSFLTLLCATQCTSFHNMFAIDNSYVRTAQHIHKEHTQMTKTLLQHLHIYFCLFCLLCVI